MHNLCQHYLNGSLVNWKRVREMTWPLPDLDRQATPEASMLAGLRVFVDPLSASSHSSGGPHGVCQRTGRNRLCIVTMDRLVGRALVLTRNACEAAPITWMRRAAHSSSHDPPQAHALVVNAGVANAATGERGLQDCHEWACAVMSQIAENHPPAEFDPQAMDLYSRISLASTGVIGDRLDLDGLRAALHARVETHSWKMAAWAIGTTDTREKVAHATLPDGKHATEPYRIVGMAKGSGMIAPNMATMLAFVFTDLPMTSQQLQPALFRGVESSFNAITIDGDTSTNDAVMAFSIGALDSAHRRPSSQALDAFPDALQNVLQDLAYQIVADGEGAKKVIRIVVEGAENPANAKKIASSVANSPLVKTAIAGGDANWGRIAMAIGNAGVPIAVNRLRIAMGTYVVMQDGCAVETVDTARLSAYLTGCDVTIRIHLGGGNASASMLTCDLTKQYIAINADYRT